jgi:hypothetical protein
MSAYLLWTEALYRYATAGIPTGDPLYLRIEPDILTDIAEREQLSVAFEDAVRQQCLVGETVVLGPLLGKNLTHKTTGEKICPAGLGWLALQVLAAYQMRPDEELSTSNYYTRLREVLQLPGQGKPAGLEYTEMGALWQQWNHWLTRQGWLPTAQQGKSTHRFTRLPISQCLLRQGELARVGSLFQAQGLPGLLSPAALDQWVRHAPLSSLGPNLSQRLQTPSDDLRELLYRYYLDGQWLSDSVADVRRTGNLQAGLRRFEDPITDRISYHLYPRQRAGRVSHHDLEVQLSEQWHALIIERSGWYQPLRRQAFHPGQSLSLPLRGSQHLRQLVFAGATCWALVSDPDNPYNGSFGTWHRPVTGEPFLLLCQERHHQALTQMRDQGLLTWRHSYPLPDLPGHWTEYYDCQTTPGHAQDWERLRHQEPELWAALHPNRQRLQLVFSDGVHAPRLAQTWLADFPPQVACIAPGDDRYCLQVLAADDDTLLCETALVPGSPLPLPWREPGDYRLELHSVERQDNAPPLAARNLSLCRWDQLPTPLPEDRYSYELENGKHMRGVVISDV